VNLNLDIFLNFSSFRFLSVQQNRIDLSSSFRYSKFNDFNNIRTLVIFVQGLQQYSKTIIIEDWYKKYAPSMKAFLESKNL